MNRLLINTEAILHNHDYVRRLVGMHDSTLTVVTKALCGCVSAIAPLSKVE